MNLWYLAHLIAPSTDIDPFKDHFGVEAGILLT